MAYSEGDGLRSVGQLDSKQKGSFVESPFLGFPICLIDEGAKGLDGFASAALASAGLGKGPCPPFRLMDWKGVTLEPCRPPALASTVAWPSADAGQPSAPSSTLWREAHCPLPKKGLGDAEAASELQKKTAVCHCRDEGLVGHKCFCCSKGCSRVHEDLPGDPQSHFGQGKITG